jgi:predicted Zn-dependent protease with MMP-like domain
MDRQEFDLIVEQALRKIPRRFRRRMDNVVIVVEMEPKQPGLLGLYYGRPLTVRSTGESFQMPDQITIYQGPHERMAGNRAQLERLVEETVWHEIAHYFGLSEAEVRRAEARHATRRAQPRRKASRDRE